MKSRPGTCTFAASSSSSNPCFFVTPESRQTYNSGRCETSLASIFSFDLTAMLNSLLCSIVAIVPLQEQPQGEPMPLTQETEYLCRVGPGTPMGELFRRFWVPVLMPEELPGPDCPPVRLRVLGEDLVAFRDSEGKPGIIGAHCPHRGASLFFGRNEEAGLRCVYHGWKFDVAGNCMDMPNEPAESNFKEKIHATAYPAR